MSEVEARRLRPVYEALDAQNPKLALKLLAKFTKPSTSTLVLSLKSLSLFRSGKDGEAVLLVEEMVAEKRVLDEFAFQAVTAMLKYLDPPRIDLLVKLYEIAVEANADGAAVGLYFAHTRLCDYARQNQIANKLFLAKKETKFLNWACLSLVLQFETCANAKMRDIVIGLAEKMMKRHWDGKEKDMDQQTALLYTDILVRKKEFESARKVLEMHFTAQVNALEWIEFEDKILLALGDFERLFQVSMQRLQENPDDWRFWNSLIEYAQKLDRLDSARNAIMKSKEANGRLRGPFLAEIQLERLRGNEDAYLNAIKTFLVSFGSKKSTFSDLKMHLPTSLESKSKLGNLLKEMLNTYLEQKSSSNALPLYQILFAIGQASQEMIQQALQLYFDFVDSGDLSKLKDTEDGPLDEVLLLFTEQLVLQSENSEITIEERSNLILHALHVVFYGMSNRKFFYMYKLWAIRLLCHPSVGAVNMAYQIFQSMDVKMIQWESLSHLLLDDTLRYGDWKIARYIAGNVFSFHVRFQRDNGDMITLAHKENKYSEAIDFSLFREKMHKSMQLRFSYSTLQLLNLVYDRKTTSDSASKNFHYGADLSLLEFNNDFSVLKTYSMENSLLLNEKLNMPSLYVYSDAWTEIEENGVIEKRAAQCKIIIQLRDCLADCLHFAVEHQKEQLTACIEKCLSLKKHLENHREKLEYFDFSIQIFKALEILLQIFVDSKSINHITALESLASILQSIQMEMKKLADQSTTLLDNEKKMYQVSLVIRKLATFVSSASFALNALIDHGSSTLLPSKKSIQKSLKKNADPNIEFLNSVRVILDETVVNVRLHISEIKRHISEFLTSDSKECSWLYLATSEDSRVLKQDLKNSISLDILASYRECFTQLLDDFSRL